MKGRLLGVWKDMDSEGEPLLAGKDSTGRRQKEEKTKACLYFSVFCLCVVFSTERSKK